MADLIVPDSRLEIPQLLYPGRKPYGLPVAVDRSHWFCNYADHVYLPDSPNIVRDMLGDQDLSPSGCTFKAGRLITPGSGHAGSFTFDRMDEGFLLVDMEWQETYDTGLHYIYNFNGSGKLITIYYNHFGPPNQFGLGVRGGFGASPEIFTGASDPSSSDLNKRHVYLFAWDFLGRKSIYIDGIRVATTTTATSADSSSATADLLSNTESKIYSIYAGGRMPPPSAINAISKNPYQVFRPVHGQRVSKIYFAEAGGGTTTAVGSSSGTSTATATGQSTAAALGSSAGVATPTATGRSTAAASGSSAGVATVTATGNALKLIVGNAAGTSTAAATAAEGGSVGSAAGTSTATATGQSTAASSGSSAGVATVTATGNALKLIVGSGAGVSTVTATGNALKLIVGSGAGTATGTGAGQSTAASPGSSTGVATVTGVALGGSQAVGAAAGLAVANGVATIAVPFVPANRILSVSARASRITYVQRR